MAKFVTKIKAGTFIEEEVRHPKNKRIEPSCAIVQIMSGRELSWELQVNVDEGVLKLWITDSEGRVSETPLQEAFTKLGGC